MTAGNASGGALAGWPAARAAAIVMGLAGCVSAPPRPYSPLLPAAGYAPALPAYRPQPRITVAPRPVYPPQVTLPSYGPQPATVGQPASFDPPASADPPPLIPVEPVGRHRVDQSCTDYWDWCHFFR